jgi:hypothetical protein
VWAKKNEAYIERKTRAQGTGVLSALLNLLSAAAGRISTPSSSSSPSAPSARGKQQTQRGSFFRSLLVEKFRAHILNESSLFNRASKLLIALNVILFALNSSSLSPLLANILYYGNITIQAIFGVELLVRFLVVGPQVYLDHPVNVLDSFLVLFGLFSLLFPDSGCVYVTIFRVLLLLNAGDPSSDSHRAISVNSGLSVSGLLLLVKRSWPAIIVYFLLLCALIYIMAVLSMFFLPQFCKSGLILHRVTPSPLPLIFLHSPPPPSSLIPPNLSLV